MGLVLTGANFNRGNNSQCLDQEARGLSTKELGEGPYITAKKHQLHQFLRKVKSIFRGLNQNSSLLIKFVRKITSSTQD